MAKMKSSICIKFYTLHCRGKTNVKMDTDNIFFGLSTINFMFALACENGLCNFL